MLGVGHLEDEVAELDLVVHRAVLSWVQAPEAEEPRRVGSERLDERVDPVEARRPPAAMTGSGVKGKSLP